VKTKIFLIVLALALALVTSSCDPSLPTPSPTPSPTPVPAASFRVVMYDTGDDLGYIEGQGVVGPVASFSDVDGLVAISFWVQVISDDPIYVSFDFWKLNLGGEIPPVVQSLQKGDCVRFGGHFWRVEIEDHIEYFVLPREGKKWFLEKIEK